MLNVLGSELIVLSLRARLSRGFVIEGVTARTIAASAKVQRQPAQADLRDRLDLVRLAFDEKSGGPPITTRQQEVTGAAGARADEDHVGAPEKPWPFLRG
jgi:hypothetical protein